MAAVHFTGAAPPTTLSTLHVRDAMNVHMAMTVFVLALLPVVVMALYNTGYQANLAMEALGVEAAPGWRGSLIESLGTGYDPSAPLAAAVHGAAYFLPLLAAVGAAAVLWAWVFAAARRRRPGPGVLTAALLVTLMLPPTMPLWLAAFAMSFGIVVGREIFGGFGRNVFNPAVVALSFLHITYPTQMMGERVWVAVEGYTGGTPLHVAAREGPALLEAAGVTWMDAFLGTIPGSFGDTSALACLLGAAVLLWFGLVSWRVIVGIGLGALAAAVLFNLAADGTDSLMTLPWTWHLVLGGFAFGAVYLATDPVTAAVTDTGRWIYGAFVGVLIVIMRVGSPLHADGVVLAVLVGSLFAPTIDYLVMRANIRRRAHRADP
jgi:Na+-transporting NADH:ubiquinone oxidoreductase subunit B